MSRIIALVISFWVSNVVAGTAGLPLTVGGDSYLIELIENTALVDGASAQLGQDVGDHYYGVIASVPDSWARVSKIDGQWQGLVSVYGSLYVVAQPVEESLHTAQAASTATPAHALTEFAEEMGSCGVGGHEGEAATSLASIMGSGIAEEVAFSSFCAAQVDGICILPEIEFVFDMAFQSLYGASAAAQATALINTAEGFYRQDRAEMDGNNGMNMAFDAITVEFLSSELFSATTDASSFLRDIRSKKTNGEIPFVKNSRALLHVITGRNFDGSTAGIAFVDAICDNNGYGTGTTSVVGSIPLTAVVMAHELGHNFGSFHDGDTASSALAGMCANETHIMSSRVRNSVSGFSSCSVTQMVDAVERVASPRQCFNYPADIAISNVISPINVNVGDTFSASHMVSVVAVGFQPVNQMTLTGTSNVGAKFTNVTANGNACDISADQGYERTSYRCIVNNGGADVTINIDGTITGWDAQAVIRYVASVFTDDAVDVLLGNNRATTTMAVAGTITEAPPPIGVDALSGDDSVSSNSASSGGGGGGSLGWPWVLSLLGLLFRRVRS